MLNSTVPEGVLLYLKVIITRVIYVVCYIIDVISYVNIST
jgi:uncharacterized MAPEG superfamily protein